MEEKKGEKGGLKKGLDERDEEGACRVYSHLYLSSAVASKVKTQYSNNNNNNNNNK
jgi:hypothetical protein